MATAYQQPNQNKRPDAPTYTPSGANARQVPSRRGFLFDRTNYMWMLGGVLLILLGFALMAGGKSPDPHQFLYDEIYSARRITVAPILILLGFIIEVYAIMKKPSNAAPDEKTM